MDGKIIAGLDIGSTNIRIAIGVVGENGLDIVGVGQASSTGIRKGSVVNIEATTEAIKKAKEEAELMSGHQIHEIWIGIGGTHIQSFQSKGMVAIRNKEVTSSDITRVIEAARAVAVPSDREVLHVLPRDYKVDEQDSITDPVGMSGVRLEASVNIITGGKTAIQNAIKCSEKAGLRVAGMVVESLASSLSTITEEEKALGVAVVDMGGGTSNIIIFTQGSVSYLASLPIGGSHVTNDVAVGLRTPPQSAETIKKKFGCAIASLVNAEETIEVEGVAGRGTRTVYRHHLCEIIEPRAEETLHFIQQEIQKSNLSDLIGSGIVLTGGASQLDGIAEMGEFVFDMPVRKGVPTRVGGLTDVIRSQQFATVIGILNYGLEHSKGKSGHRAKEVHLPKWMSKIKNLFDEI